MFQDLLAGLALALVLEGILPFVKPDSARRVYEMLSRSSEESLRAVGLVCMVAGCIVLFLVRS